MRDDARARVEAAIERAIAEKGEIGIQVAAYLGGELVLDCSAGVADWETGTDVRPETLFPVFSATKAVTATAAHIAAERGLIDYDAPIARYWPEFGAHGKETITVRQALTHMAGLPQMPEGCTLERFCDWDWVCSGIAELAPLWEPGTKHAYHAYTFGWLLGEVVRRIDLGQRPFGRWVQEEICGPLGIEALWLGLPEEMEPRVARLKDLPQLSSSPRPDSQVGPPEPSLGQRAVPVDIGTKQAVFGRSDVRRACLPGIGGMMNARSLARHWALLAGFGELDGVRLLSRQRVEEARTLCPATREPDALLRRVILRGLGYILGRPGGAREGRPAEATGAFGHGGIGGTLAWCEPDEGFAAALLHNRMVAPAENPLTEVAAVLREALLG